MDDQKMVSVLARVEDERTAFERGVKGALGFNMATWFSQKGRNEGTSLCGTTACLAGHAAASAGYVLDAVANCWTPEGRRVGYVEEIGREILGLSEYEADTVFYLDTLDDVYEWAAHKMDLDVTVLREKVQAERRLA